MVFGILDSFSARSQINSINHYSHSSLYLSTHYPKSKYQNKQAPNPFWKTLSHSRSLSRTTRIAHSNTHKPQAVKHVSHLNDKLKNSLSFQFVTIFPQTKKIQITQKENSKKTWLDCMDALDRLWSDPYSSSNGSSTSNFAGSTRPGPTRWTIKFGKKKWNSNSQNHRKRESKNDEDFLSGFCLGTRNGIANPRIRPRVWLGEGFRCGVFGGREREMQRIWKPLESILTDLTVVKGADPKQKKQLSKDDVARDLAGLVKWL